MSITASQLRVDSKPFVPAQKAHPKEVAMNQFDQWGFGVKERKLVETVLGEWFAASTLENVFRQWGQSPVEISNQKVVLNILCYNIQGWGSRSLEVMDLIYRVEAVIGVLTEVGELWNTSRIPHFNIFHQHGTNKSGGVSVVIGKHLRATRIDCSLENTIIIDVDGLTESVRLIAIYWPASQRRRLEDLEPFINENTILTGDFNASIKEWGSTTTDRRGRELKEWVEENSLYYIPTTAHSSKRSKRNIDLTFTNMGEVRGETMNVGTSDHWPSIITCENVMFERTNLFPHVHWKMFEALLALFQEFWIREQNTEMKAEEWYDNYVRFLAALKNRLTQWKKREKFRPALPSYLLHKLREVKKVRNQYYRERKAGKEKDALRILLRVSTREVNIEIAKYKSNKWHEFLGNVQQKHDDKENAFWKYLSRVYKRKSPSLSKLDDGRTLLRKDKDISEELYRYYSDQFKPQEIDKTDQNELQIESEYEELLAKMAITNEEIERTSAFEIKRYIAKLKPKTSSDLDTVSNLMIK